MKTVTIFDEHNWSEYSVCEIGQLNQEQFIAGVQRCIPPQELQQLLRFEIIPSQVLHEVNDQPSLPSPGNSSRRPNDAETGDMISDNQLRQIATQAARRDWEGLAAKLGFLEYDIEAYKVQNDSDPSATVWNDRFQLYSNQADDFLFRCIHFFKHGVNKTLHHRRKHDSDNTYNRADFKIWFQFSNKRLEFFCIGDCRSVLNNIGDGFNFSFTNWHFVQIFEHVWTLGFIRSLEDLSRQQRERWLRWQCVIYFF